MVPWTPTKKQTGRFLNHFLEALSLHPLGLGPPGDAVFLSPVVSIYARHVTKPEVLFRTIWEPNNNNKKNVKIYLGPWD